jgi:hypothetical protein
MIQISLLALLINGAFVNMEYFELVYQLVGIVSCLKVICYRELARTQNASEEQSQIWIGAQPQYGS